MDRPEVVGSDNARRHKADYQELLHSRSPEQLGIVDSAPAVAQPDKASPFFGGWRRLPGFRYPVPLYPPKLAIVAYRIGQANRKNVSAITKRRMAASFAESEAFDTFPIYKHSPDYLLLPLD